MRRLGWLLVFAVACALPRGGLAAPGLLQQSASHTLSCGMQVSGEETSRYHRLKCLTGVAVSVSPRAMRVRPQRGSIRSVRFTDDTLFETDSGEGALNGLTVNDRVCVAYTAGSPGLTGHVVAFNPHSKPCGSGKNPRPVGGPSGDGAQEQD